MTRSHLDRLLSLGHSDAIPDRLARHVRVTNALALLGFVLAFVTTPLDAIDASRVVVATDLLALAGFAAVWPINAKGRYDLARATLLSTTNVVLLVGVVGIGGLPELRTVFFPLVLMPFLVFDVVSERLSIAIFVALPVAAYFITGQLDLPPPSVARDVDRACTPVLSFLLIVGGCAVFGSIQRSAEAKVLHARERAAQSTRLVALGQMSSGIAHEIRNPLTAIHLAAGQLALRSGDPTAIAELGERIQQILMRTSRIIEGLRTFARDASSDPFVTARVERIVQDTLELCGRRLDDHDVQLTVEPTDPELVIECRPVQLSQVLVNLLGNAYDAVTSAPDRWIRIDVRVDGDWLELAVVDSGPGIPPDARLRVFEPFFSTKAPDRGTGIGLSLSRGIVQAHHGALALDEQSPHTRFVVRLPLRQPAA